MVPSPISPNRHEDIAKVADVCSTAEIIAEASSGRLVIIVDSPARENEGDLIIPAQKVMAEHINFMIKHGRGLVCLALDERRAKQLQLDMMPRRNPSKLNTAFTVSIDAKDGITTGISAYERAHTIQVALNLDNGPDKITTPGHVFPVVAKNKGTLERRGHTEAACDIARLAGCYPAGVMCEIIDDDGEPARFNDLKKFAVKHQIKIGTIKDIAEYLQKSE